MDKYDYFKDLEIEKDIAKIIENDIFLENYSIGEEIINPETPIDKFSIILSGSVRQIRRDSKKHTNLYKYDKNDFLFIPELIYSLKNSLNFLILSTRKNLHNTYRVSQKNLFIRIFKL